MGHADLPEELADLIRPLRRRAHAGAGRRAELRPAGVRAARRSRHHPGPAARRQGDRTPRRPDHRPLPRGDDHPGRARAQRRAGRLAGPGARPGRARPRCRGSRGWSPGSALRPPGRPTCRCPSPFDAAAPFKRFVSQLLALRLRRIVEADLAIRGGDLDGGRPAGRRGGPAAGRAQGAVARCSTRSGSRTSTTSWAGSAWTRHRRTRAAADRLASRLRSERYLTVLERLVGAVAHAEAGRGAAPSPPGRCCASWSRPPCDRLRQCRGRLDRRLARGGVGRGLAGDRAGCSGCSTSRPRCCPSEAATDPAALLTRGPAAGAGARRSASRGRPRC